jgi:molybdopterin-guanine dinucleotide biosynthesis protein A
MSRILGAIIAGGRSVRFGAPKPLAVLAGRRLVDRVAAALEPVSEAVVLIANDPDLAAATGLPWRSDVLEDVGSLAGVHAALLWARERNCAGVLALAADMPLVPAVLLRRLRELGTDGWDVGLPESEGPRGVEPLCAWYGTACIEAIEAAAERGDARMIGFHDDVRVCRIPIQEVRAFGDPERLFMNINTPEDHALVDRWLAEASA